MSRGGLKVGRLQVLVKALRLLRFIADHRFGVTVQEMVQECEISRRDVYRYLGAYESAGVGLHKFKTQIDGPHKRWRLLSPPGRLAGVL